MEQNQITAKLIELSETISKNTADIASLNLMNEELCRRSREHGRIINSIHELALSVKELTLKVSDFSQRLAAIEDDRRFKSRSVWQTLLTAVLGGLITYLASSAFGI